jgi:signal transduction histidine kinase
MDNITGKRALIWGVSEPSRRIVVGISARLDTTGKALDLQFGSSAHPVEFVVMSADRKVQIAGASQADSALPSGFTRAASASGYRFADASGTDHFWSEASVRDFGWHVYAGVRTSDAFAAARDDLRQRAALAVLFSVLALLVVAVIHRRIVRPIHAIRAAMRKVAAGDFDASVRPSGPVELTELGEGFNRMIEIRAKADAALHAAFEAEQKAAEDLREVDQMRNAFLMAISHELRTPLTSVVGFATILQQERDTMSPCDRDRAIDAVVSQSKRLERLLLDLLDIDRMSRGVLEPNRTDVDVRGLIEGVVGRFPQTERITTKVTKATKAHVDPALVERIVENLVNNALKHTPPSSPVWVKVKSNNGHLEIAVDDAGSGIPDECKASVFEPFNQGAIKEPVSGTGVGLALVKQFAKLQGGDAWVEDRRGGGSSFRVVLPATARSSRRTRGVAA